MHLPAFIAIFSFFSSFSPPFLIGVHGFHVKEYANANVKAVRLFDAGYFISTSIFVRTTRITEGRQGCQNFLQDGRAWKKQNHALNRADFQTPGGVRQ
jgi:hypothetical protein